ncbi:MAG: hypothetical protein NE327_03380 [Lentisphaeraceae bacterium]|nr:hypothetical protein [Lentisphaeraceae bacterium]
MNLLFICSKNRLRSPTAEEVFSCMQGLDAVGCGISKEAPTALSGDLVEWADIIFTMEDIHRSKVTQKYSKLLKNKRLICLNIPDIYSRMQPELVELLKEKVMGHLQ